MLGLFNIIKPSGYSSSDVVVKVRGMLRRHYGIKNIKVGHLGTLDPGGSGVLPIVFGKATKLFDYLSHSEKLYRAEFVFGKTTDTLDSYSPIAASCEKVITIEDIRAIIPEFVGKIMQIPPSYSRISVDGVRACDAARRGQSMELTAREVEIRRIDIVRGGDNRLTLDIECGGGTYIRSLARDMAHKLGSVAYMSYIIRLAARGLSIDTAITLDELSADIKGNMLPIDVLLEGLERVEIRDSDRLLHGLPAKSCDIVGDYVGLIGGKIYGICRNIDGVIHTVINLFDYENSANEVE